MIQVRPYQSADYATAAAWWQAHAFPPVPEPVLPALGMVAEQGGAALAMAWIYLDNSVGVGMMEWIVSNPANPPKISAVAIAHTVRCLRSAAAALDYHVILASCRQESLARLIERAGFQRTDSGMIHLVSLPSPSLS
jgi:hypothetical protein